MANLDFYGMFDYADGDNNTYEYTSEEFSELIKQISGIGIFNNYGDKFECTANGLDISMGTGMCMILGRFGGNASQKTFSLDAETVSLSRIDRIVLAVDISNRVIKNDVVKGIAASSPTAPALTQTETYYEIPVYRALITNGSIVTLTDERNIIYTPTEINDELDALRTIVDGKANTSHTHSISNITNLQSTLDGKAASSHTHTKSQITDLMNAFTWNQVGTYYTIPNYGGMLLDYTIPSQAGKKEIYMLISDSLGINAYYGTIFSPLKTDGTPLWERLHIMIKGDDGTFGHVNVRFNSATSITIEIPTDQYLPADRLYIYTR